LARKKKLGLTLGGLKKGKGQVGTPQSVDDPSGGEGSVLEMRRGWEEELGRKGMPGERSLRRSRISSKLEIFLLYPRRTLGCPRPINWYLE